MSNRENTRRLRWAGAACLTLTALVACARSNDDASSPPPADATDGGHTLIEDASADAENPADAGAIDATSEDVDAAPPKCSAAGWCDTELPSQSIILLRNIVPFEHHAFVLAFGTSIGWKVLEWDDEGGWKYIDDGTQNALNGTGNNLWAPNEDELYFTLIDGSGLSGGTAGGFVYHGVRPTLPGTTWTWNRWRFDCTDDLYDTPFVGGTGDDLFVSSCRKIYRATQDATVDGGVAWETVFTDDVNESVLFGNGVTFSFSGTSGSEYWFVGRRTSSSCGVMVRASSSGVEKFVDSTVSGSTCADKAGYFNFGKLQFADAMFLPSGGMLVIPSVTQTVQRITPNGDGTLTSVTATLTPPLPSSTPILSPFFNSLWGENPDDLWFVVDPRSSSNAVVQATNYWDAQSATSGYSTIALNGAANTIPLSQVRGSSKKNLWVIGNARALHKTTP